MLKNMKLAPKIIAGYLVIVAFVFFTGIVGYWGIKVVARSLFQVGDEEAPIVDMANEMKLALMTTRNAMEEFKAACAVVATDDEENLSKIEDTYQKTLDDFDDYALAILEGGEVNGVSVIKTDNAKLAKLVRDSDRVHNNRFQLAAKDMMKRGKELLKKRIDRNKAMRSMEDIYDDVVSRTSAVEKMISEEIRKRADESNISKEAEAILREEIPLADMANELKISLAETRIALEEFVQFTDEGRLDGAERQYREKIKAFDLSARAILEGANVNGTTVIATDNPKIRTAVQQLDERHETFQEIAARLMSAQRDMVAASNAAEKAMTELDAQGEAASKLLDDVKAAAGEEMSLAKRIGAASVTTALGSIVAVAVFSVVLGIFIGLVLTRSITKPILKATSIAEAVAKGDLSQRLDVERSDEVGQLANALNAMGSRLLENRTTLERNDWIKTGQAALNDQMRGDMELNDLLANVMNYLADYLNAQVGAFYVMDGDGRLKMLSTYAFEKRKTLTTDIEPGVGLVGQAALEKKIILLTDNVPEDYINVSSGLGQAPPRNIIVLPLLHEGQVKGIIELGSLDPISDVKLDYLKLVAENVAIAINSAQARDQVQQLLQKTQAQSEELQTQQDELKASNEELEEQTQALQQSEEKLKVQQEELEVVNEELEEKNQSLTLQKRQVEDAQKAITEKAEEVALASKYKSEFLANMSHELRTPLNSLLLLARSLRDNKDGNLTSEQVESAGIIYGSGNDLLALINEILDLAKIEAGRMSLDIERVPLGDLAQTIRDSFAHMSSEKGLDLNVELVGDVPKIMVTDSKKLQQILKNLVSNALKFTEDGRIDVRFHPSPSGVDLSRSGLDPRRAIAISVADTGIGIARDHQKVIFEAFQQADGSTSRKFGGTGLGLSISRELVKLLGGEIQVQSEKGKGSTFTVYLPRELQVPEQGNGPSPAAARLPDRASATDPRLRRALDEVAEGQAPSEDRPALTGVADDRDGLTPKDKSILIIEDDVKFARSLVTHCRQKGLKCLVALTGEDGLDLARQYMPDAVILDIKLPGIDGWQVLERIKEDTRIRHIPVHVMSVVEPSTKAFRKGAIGHLQKPVTREGIEGALNKIEEATSTDIKRLLVVEDDKDTRRGIVELVGGKDVEVDEAAGANDAIEAVLSREYDCMILDLGLWDMDGEKLLEAIEKDEDARLPPVIVYTGRELSREEEMRLREYTESIIIKDVRSEERLLDEVSLFLHRVVNEMPPKKRQVIIDLHNSDTLFQGRKILIVEDDMRSSFALSKLLEEHGMSTLKAEDGEKALKILDAHPDMDLVLMDIMMPVMDGYETMGRIRSDERFAKLPIIALTAKAMKGDAEKCLAAGANDYLAKPIDEERLFSVMRVWLYG